MAFELDGGIKIYLREIGKTDLLTREQEVDLAARIAKGDAEARAHLISANLRLVVKIAQDYSNYGLPLLDLISEGNIGLIKAVERFDPNKGGKLSTYAAWWIKQSIKRALANQSKTIRLPVHMADKISKMRRVAMAMSEELGREPTEDELSEEIGIDRSKISQLKTASMRPASLDAPISDDDSTEFGEIIGDDNARTPFDHLSDKNMKSQLDGLLTVLNERELKIISARYGLNGQKARTLEEVGKEYGITRERIRQLQNIALRKLRRALQKKEEGTRERISPRKKHAGGSTVMSFDKNIKETIKQAEERGHITVQKNVLIDRHIIPFDLVTEEARATIVTLLKDDYKNRPDKINTACKSIGGAPQILSALGRFRIDGVAFAGKHGNYGDQITWKHLLVRLHRGLHPRGYSITIGHLKEILPLVGIDLASMRIPIIKPNTSAHTSPPLPATSSLQNSEIIPDKRDHLITEHYTGENIQGCEGDISAEVLPLIKLPARVLDSDDFSEYRIALERDIETRKNTLMPLLLGIVDASSFIYVLRGIKIPSVALGKTENAQREPTWFELLFRMTELTYGDDLSNPYHMREILIMPLGRKMRKEIPFYRIEESH